MNLYNPFDRLRAPSSAKSCSCGMSHVVGLFGRLGRQ